MKLKIYALLFLLYSFSCNINEEKSGKPGFSSTSENKFDKTKWSLQSDNDDYPYRDKMIKDLMGNAILKGLKMEEVLDLLGQPTRSDTNYLFYRVSQKRIGFFPIHTKSLVIKFSGDTTVEWVKIHE